MTHLGKRALCEAVPVGSVPYDRWVDPEGDEYARFYRVDGGFLVRFMDRVDFFIDSQTYDVGCEAAGDTSNDAVINLYHNAILPIIGNHNGELNLHGSAVSNGAEAIAFMGVSRRGKTTLAASFAKAGFPFLTEDVLALKQEHSHYLVLPSRPLLRLFADSAAFLNGAECNVDDDEEKSIVDACAAIPHECQSVPLRSIFVLGPGNAKDVALERLEAGCSFDELIQQSFILDVEDRVRLRSHFERIGALADRVPCYKLDYPREFDLLPQVQDAIVYETGWNDVRRQANR